MIKRAVTDFQVALVLAGMRAGATAWQFVRRFAVSAGVLASLSLPVTSSAPAGADTRPTPDEVRQRLETLSPEEQVPYLRELRSRRPGDATLIFYLGNAYLNLSKPDSAVIYYEQAVAADSIYSKAHVNLGIALERLSRFEDAKTHYERAIDIDSTAVLAYCHLGHYYHTRGDLGEAVKRYQQALDIDPQSAQAHYNLGLAFADSRLFGEALREWRKVVALAPESELGRTAAENVRLIETYMELDGKRRTEP